MIRTEAWHEYEVTDEMPVDLRIKMLEEIQHNNLGPSKVLLDFNAAFSSTKVSIYDSNPFHSYFILKYHDYIIKSHAGETQI